MPAFVCRIGALLLAGGALAACSVDAFTYTVGRYGTVNAVHVHLGCHDTYEVFDRREDGTLIVVTTPVNEAVLDACGEGAAGLARPERLRRGAEIFLSETTDRPDCRITRETEITPYHREFAYRCPSAAPPEPIKRARRRG